MKILNCYAGITVLSLFDGMSCGQIALSRLGIKVKKYYAAEIKAHAIRVTKHNFPDTIHIGDVTKVSYKDGILYTENGDFECGNIDLLIGGSPCQDLSAMNKNQIGLAGSKSSLFWEYNRIRKEILSYNEDLQFMLENVGSSPSEDLKIITKTLWVDGVRINSDLVSAQMRDRIYWTNIPGSGVDLFGNKYIQQPIDKGILLQDILESGYTTDKKSACLLARSYNAIPKSHDSMQRYLRKRYAKKFVQIIFEDDNTVRFFTQKELELLQTVPIGYTDCLSMSEASDVLGDGWTIDVICHIFNGLDSYNQIKQGVLF